MLKNKFCLALALLFVMSISQFAKSQTNCVAIVLNEISVGNNSYPDNYGTHDAVELYNSFTSSVSLQSYYLSNDRTNLFKWKFPSTFTLGVGGYGMVYLSGINESKLVGSGPSAQWYHHTNFTIDQCKNQWLILSTAQGVIRDSVFIQKTAIGHTWGRVDYCQIGINSWRLHTAHSFPLPNPTVGYFKGYMPMPKFTPTNAWGQNGQTLGILVNGMDADSTNSCNEVHYTTDGRYPTLTDPVYTGTNPPTPTPLIVDAMIFRAVNYPKTVSMSYTPNLICLADPYLPSFCETNTYFSESTGAYDKFSPDFGVMSVAIHSVDTNWFNTSGATQPTVHVEYYDNKQKVVEGYAVVTRPPQEAWQTKQKGFYLTIDDRRGYGCNFEGNIFNVAGLGTTNRTIFPTLHVKGGDIESHSPAVAGGAPSKGTGLRDVFYQSLAAKYNVKVNPLHIKPLILFINGKYTGVYDLREVYDKYYEDYYNPIAGNKDSMYCQFYHNGDGWIKNYEVDNSTSNMPPLGTFSVDVYAQALKPLNNAVNYNKLMSKLDKESFMDYMIFNSYALNSNLYNYNVGFARNGGNKNPGKWHYYLWNVPATFTFQAVYTNTLVYANTYFTPCRVVQSTSTLISQYAGNSHGYILNRLMTTPDNTGLAAGKFQLEYKNRYQDLLNSALKCENILAHFDYVASLYKKEMNYHEDPASAPTVGQFPSLLLGDWDTNVVKLRQAIESRCKYFGNAFNTAGCYGMQGPFDLTVDVYPQGAGTVKLNTIVLPFYIWTGRYYNAQLSFKAIPTSTNYVFHHWEFKTHPVKNNVPLSVDSVAIDFNGAEQVLAVFTDITSDVDLPTGFTPNGDGNNDQFKPLGSALYTKEYEFRIWNRWGQEVFRSTEPSFGWDGNFEGKEAQTGVYAYVITYKNVYNESKIKKGNVTLVR